MLRKSQETDIFLTLSILKPFTATDPYSVLTQRTRQRISRRCRGVFVAHEQQSHEKHQKITKKSIRGRRLPR